MYKVKLLTSLLVVSSLFGCSKPKPSELETQVCELITLSAEVAMMSRQKGHDISGPLSLYAKGGLDEFLDSLVSVQRNIVRTAYEYKIADTEANQQIVVQRFVSKVTEEYCDL